MINPRCFCLQRYTIFTKLWLKLKSKSYVFLFLTYRKRKKNFFEQTAGNARLYWHTMHNYLHYCTQQCSVLTCCSATYCNICNGQWNIFILYLYLRLRKIMYLCKIKINRYAF